MLNNSYFLFPWTLCGWTKLLVSVTVVSWVPGSSLLARRMWVEVIHDASSSGSGKLPVGGAPVYVSLLCFLVRCRGCREELGPGWWYCRQVATP